MVKIREIAVPLAVVGIVVSMLIPLPPAVLDYLLVANFLLAFALLLSALCLTDPLKLSALPTMLLLSTLYRLALNVSSTRLILGSGTAGSVIEACGSIVIRGNLAVGAVIFLIITLIQFIVIAKGSERVAEVAARFTLDALPGKQMAIDADVRSGFLDADRARQRREELQVESRFYGALDGAMKFIKGDAIAGLVIVVVNIIGGFALGMISEGLSASQAISKYSLLTVGEGLVSQLPALLNSLAAGIVVTKVVRSEHSSLASDIVGQLLQVPRVRAVVCGVALGMALLPGLPRIPLLAAAALLYLFGADRERPVGDRTAEEPRHFQPRLPSLLTVEVSGAGEVTGLAAALELFREQTFRRTGLLLPRVEIATVSGLAQGECRIQFRGIHQRSLTAAATGEGIEPGPVVNALSELVSARAVELVDDLLTRRMLDCFDSEAPELVSAVIPSVVSVTQLTVVLKGLVRERVSIRHFDQILQAVAEAGPRATDERQLLYAVREQLGRVIVAPYLRDGRFLDARALDPQLDIELRAESVQPGSFGVERALDLAAAVGSDRTIIVASREARRALADLCRSAGIDAAAVAYEEIPADIELNVIDNVGAEPGRGAPMTIAERRAA